MKINPAENIPTASSNTEVWVQWHKDLKKIFGKKKANSIWVYAWSKRGGINSPANTTNLSNYMEGQGVDIQRTGLDEIGEAISDITSGVFGVAKILVIGGLVTGGLILFLILRALFKNPNKSLDNIMLLSPQGRAIQGAKALKN